MESYLCLLQRYEPLGRLWKAFSLARILRSAWKMSANMDLPESEDILDEFAGDKSGACHAEACIKGIHDFEAAKRANRQARPAE